MSFDEQAPRQKPTFDQCKLAVHKALRTELGKEPVYNETNKYIFQSLTAYFFGFEELCQKRGIDLSKGICLFGSVGCGKTKIMRVFQNLTRSFAMTDTRKIGYDFAKSGHQTLERYGRSSFVRNSFSDEKKANIWCFDDLGVEGAYKFYAQEVDVMADILLSRYDNIRFGMITHCTTNLDSQEIMNKYGERVHSRFFEMFNVIKFGECQDFRRATI